MDHADHGGHGDSHETDAGREQHERPARPRTATVEPSEARDAGRVTSPMQEFSTTRVGAGVAVLAAGLALTFGLALLLG